MKKSSEIKKKRVGGRSERKKNTNTQRNKRARPGHERKTSFLSETNAERSIRVFRGATARRGAACRFSGGTRPENRRFPPKRFAFSTALVCRQSTVKRPRLDGNKRVRERAAHTLVHVTAAQVTL